MDKLDIETIEKARNADIIAFLERRCGFTFSNQHGVHRCDQHPSLAIKHDRHSWYWHSKDIGGYGPIDFLMKTENVPFREAVQTIGPNRTPAPPVPTTPEQPKTLILPEKASLPAVIYEYLCVKRGIDGGIVDALIQEGKLYQDKWGNCVLIGFDEDGKPRHASVRGTNGKTGFRYDCAGSDKRYGFCMEYIDSDQVRLYESPIDAMSVASIENIIKGDNEAWKRVNRLSLAGVSGAAIPKYLETHPLTKELVFCLDNDDAGRGASVALSRKYADKGYYVRTEPPLNKDYNDDLIEIIKQIKSEREHITKHNGDISI